MVYNKPTLISTQTTTTIAATGGGVIHTINIHITTTGTVTFQSTAATPVVYFVLPVATVANSYLLDVVFGNGLAVVTSAADNLMVTTGQ